MFALKSVFLWKLILTFTDRLQPPQEKEGGMLCYVGSKNNYKIKSEKKKDNRFVWAGGKKKHFKDYLEGRINIK